MDSRKDAARVRFFPPGIPVIVIVSGLLLQWIAPLRFGPAIPAIPRYLTGIVIAVSAITLLGGWSVILFHRSGQSANPWTSTPHLETRGPFRVTRNPMYLQMVIVCLAAAIACANWWILLLTPVAAFALQRLAIEPEETYLENRFGDTYRDYKTRVRRWL
jgi:protein-S-isoprenylcysteine O-methyltransferase Ste14